MSNQNQAIMLAFFQKFFSGGKIHCYANFFCYANFSIVFEPNFGGGQKSLRGQNARGGAPCSPVEESQNEVEESQNEVYERSSQIYNLDIFNV